MSPKNDRQHCCWRKKQGLDRRQYRSVGRVRLCELLLGHNICIEVLFMFLQQNREKGWLLAHRKGLRLQKGGRIFISQCLDRIFHVHGIDNVEETPPRLLSVIFVFRLWSCFQSGTIEKSELVDALKGMFPVEPGALEEVMEMNAFT